MPIRYRWQLFRCPRCAAPQPPSTCICSLLLRPGYHWSLQLLPLKPQQRPLESKLLGPGKQPTDTYRPLWSLWGEGGSLSQPLGQIQGPLRLLAVSSCAWRAWRLRASWLSVTVNLMSGLWCHGSSRFTVSWVPCCFVVTEGLDGWGKTPRGLPGIAEAHPGPASWHFLGGGRD